MNYSGNHSFKVDHASEVCYYVNQTAGNYFQSTSVMTQSLPTFILQLTVVLFTARLLLFILKPLRQPHIVAYIVSGVLLGPSVLGQTSFFLNNILPIGGIKTLETFANLSLVYYMFLVGLEMDLIPILNSGSEVLRISICGIVIPFLSGFGLFFLLHQSSIKGAVFWAIALTATNFQDLTRVLTDLKLLRTDIGKLALSSSVISDFCTWLLLVLAMSMLNPYPYYAAPSVILFILVCIYVIRPIISTIMTHVVKRDNFTEQHIWFILGWIVLFGFITDVCGLHSMVGSFMFGVIMPRREIIKVKLIERLDEFVSWIMMPLFFLTSGIRTDIRYMIKTTEWHVVALFILLSFLAKIVSTSLPLLFFSNKPMQDGFALGALMNTKGVLSLIILNIGRNIKVLNKQTFALMVLSVLVMTCLVEPIVSILYKPQKSLLRYKRRTIESVISLGKELQILACVHSTRDAHSMISLLEASNANEEFPIFVIAMHLVELTGRSTAMLIVHDQCQATNTNFRHLKSESDQIIDAFKSYEKSHNGVMVQPISAVSPYNTMHEDICSLAEDKRACLIIIPFYNELTADGRIEDAKPTFPDMNQYVLENAPCSVGLFIDRGLKSITSAESTGKSSKGHHIAMLFIEGPDDRDALAYAWRMTGHPGVRLTVIRFLPGKNASAENNSIGSSINQGGLFISTSRNEREKRLDDEYVYDFMFRTLDDESITYTEKVVNNGDETLAAIKENGAHYDLYIVGRGWMRNRSALTSGLSDWNSCQELGALGDALASSSFASHASVLVVQQYVPKNYRATAAEGQLKPPVGSSSWNPLMDDDKNGSNINNHQRYVEDQDEEDDNDEDHRRYLSMKYEL